MSVRRSNGIKAIDERVLPSHNSRGKANLNGLREEMDLFISPPATLLSRKPVTRYLNYPRERNFRYERGGNTVAVARI